MLRHGNDQRDLFLNGVLDGTSRLACGDIYQRGIRMQGFSGLHVCERCCLRDTV